MKKFWLILTFLFAVFSADEVIAQYSGYQVQRYEGFHSLKNWNKRLQERYSMKDVLKGMDGSPSERRKAVGILARFSDESQVREALENVLLSDPNVEVRWKTAISLGRIGDSASIAVLDKAGLNDPVEQVRETAKYMARKIRFKNSLALVENSNEAIRQEAVKKIAELPFDDSEKAVGILAKVLRSDLSPPVRKEAAKVLGQIESVRAFSALSIALKQDPDAEVRQEVQNSIVNIQKKIFAKLLKKLWQR